MSDADSSWVFESLVGFLRGPVWNIPILTFIENKSLIFESNSSSDEENYKVIFDEYKNLVDFMLGSYMEEIGITPEQFEAACGKASTNIKDRIHQTLFEQVWAADDYEIFVRMMTQKNLELQLQALELLQKKYGVVPKSFVRGGEDEQKASGSNWLSDEDQKVMDVVIKKSLDDHELYLQLMTKEKQDLEKAIAMSQVENDRLASQHNFERKRLQEAITKQPVSEGQFSAPPVNTSKVSVNPEDLAKRKAYLLEQRDKLLALKRQEREKQLRSSLDPATGQNKRPKTAKAANQAMKGETLDPKTLLIRRALAEKLKKEVLEKQ